MFLTARRVNENPKLEAKFGTCDTIDSKYERRFVHNLYNHLLVSLSWYVNIQADKKHLLWIFYLNRVSSVTYMNYHIYFIEPYSIRVRFYMCKFLGKYLDLYSLPI